MSSFFGGKTLLRFIGIPVFFLFFSLNAAEIREHLDSDADFYFHKKQELPRLPADSSTCPESLKILHEIAEEAGIYSINGFGYSIKHLNGGLIRRKLFFSEKPETENRQSLLWNLLDGPSFSIKEKAALFPKNTLAVTVLRLDAAAILEFAKAQFAKYQRTTLLSMIRGTGALMKKCGFPPADLFRTYAKEFSIAAVPDPGAERSAMPFSLIFMIKMKEEQFFRMFADKLPLFLLQKKESPGKNIAFVLPVPWTRFSICLAKRDDNMILTTSLPLMERLFAMQETGNTLADHPEFQTMASALTPQCSAFSYASPEFYRLMKESGHYPQWALNLFAVSGLCPVSGTLSAAQRLPDGILSERVTQLRP